MSIEDRLARLEKSCRRWRWLASVSVLLLLALVVMGQAAPKAKVTEFETLKVGELEAKSITTSRVGIVDASGMSRAVLCLSKDEPVLALRRRPGRHTLDVLACREIDSATARLYMAPGDVACIADLPRRLAVSRDGDRMSVAVDRVEQGAEVVLVDLEGETLAEEALADGPLRFDLAALNGQPALVKLMVGGVMVDAVGLAAMDTGA